MKRTRCTRMVSNLKKASMTLLLLAFALLFFAIAPTYANVKTINAKATTSSLADVQVGQVNHTIKIQDGGLVVINDTLKLFPKPPKTWVLLQNFSLGFPYKINDKEIIDTLEYCFAYDASNSDERFEVERDVGLGGRIGFYGVNVIFPESGLNISSSGRDLTVVFVFFNLLSSETATSFNLDFPMYPSLAQNASACNVTIILVPYANMTHSDFNFTKVELDNSQILKYTKSPLDSFQYEPTRLKFELIGQELPWIHVDEIKREIKIDQWGGIQLSDSYRITNKAPSILANIYLRVPEGARHPISAWDEFGPMALDLMELQKGIIGYSFRTPINKGEAGRVTVTYHLPWEKYVNQRNWRDYGLSFTFLEQLDWIIRKLEVSITLPKGAEFQSSNPLDPYNVQKSVFQETITFTFFNITPFHDLDFDLTYGYLVFWASFYPTLWMGVLVIVACAIALLWRVPKPPAVPMVPVPPEDLRSFVKGYEGKTRILSELESMEQRLRKGRIPRRRYKVRKKMLEGRLSTLSRDLSDLREKIRTAGPKYANIMRQIEVAETMLEGVETDIRRVEARYRRGEISKGAYGRLLEEYHRRRERANTTIDGVLLRLREEIR